MFEKIKKVSAIKKTINHTELSIVERSSIVNEVITKCFIDSEYHSEYVKPMFTFSVLRMFTTISPIMMKNEDETISEYVDVEATYKYCVDNHVIDYVIDKCKFAYIDDLFSEVIESIEYKKSMEISRISSVSDKIILSVTDLIDTAKNAIGKFDVSQYTDVIKLAKDIVGKKITNDTLAKAAIKNIVKDMPKKDVSKIDNITPIEG